MQKVILSFIAHSCREIGGSQIDMVYVYRCLLGCFFAKFGIAIRMKEPKVHKLDVFWANCYKKHL